MPPFVHQVKWTEDEYLIYEEHSETKHEFYDGEVYAMAGAKGPHNFLCAQMNAALVSLVRGRGCRVFTSDQRVHVAIPKKFYTYPDGGVVCGEPNYHPKAPEMVLLNPVLLFEVLSPSTEKYDRGTKLFLYRQIESLTDVLLIDQPAHLVEHHHRGPKGWKSTRRHRGAIHILGGAIQMEDFYQEPA